MAKQNHKLGLLGPLGKAFVEPSCKKPQKTPKYGASFPGGLNPLDHKAGSRNYRAGFSVKRPQGLRLGV